MQASAILTQTFFILSISMVIAATPFCILNMCILPSMMRVDKSKFAAPILGLLPIST